jgi:hypothetical protein
LSKAMDAGVCTISGYWHEAKNLSTTAHSEVTLYTLSNG